MAGKIKGAEQNPAPQHQNHSTKSIWICLTLFIIFTVCLIAGKTINNIAIEAFGAGVGFALLVMTAHENLKEDNK